MFGTLDGEAENRAVAHAMHKLTARNLHSLTAMQLGAATGTLACELGATR